MKYRILILLAFGFAGRSEAQGVDQKSSRYIVSAQYTQEFVLDGYVRVREWELAGDKMRLRDLGMDTYSAMQLRLERKFRKAGALRLVYDQYFIRGSAIFNRDITYNGTIIDGRAGIDVSPTRYYRLSLAYNRPLAIRNEFELSGVFGLVLDHIVFYLDGKVTASSPNNEVHEGFGRQAFPYPFVGLFGRCHIWSHSSLCFETSGTYIPKFESFYTEGGNVYLDYSNFLADVKYASRLSQFELGVGGKLRHMKLFQESREDTNELNTLTAGPYLELTYHFR